MASKIEQANKVFQLCLAIFVVLLAFILFYILCFKGIPASQRDIVIFILGCVSGNVTQIIGYYFGSSKGSADKSKTLESMTNSSQPPSAPAGSKPPEGL